jgi:RNA polymerase sigma-70 factor (ECF subfamily)
VVSVVRGARSIVDDARRLSGPARTAEPATIDGRPGAAVIRDGAVALVLSFTIAGNLVDGFDVVADPSRLAGMVVQPRIEAP